MLNKELVLILLFLLCIGSTERTQAQTSRTVPFTFTLANEARTSAGVFTKDGVLIRTLWSGVKLPAGSQTKNWDGLDDLGQPAPNASYDIRLISNNVSYTWEGVLGNSSFKISQGNNVQRGFLRIQSIAIAGNTAYYGVGYAEGNPSQAKFPLNNPQQRIEFSAKNTTDQATLFTATDGKTVYWAGYDGYDNGNTWFVYGTNTSDDQEKSFPSGQPLKMLIGKTYASCFDIIREASGTVTGLAVQKNGNFLFVSHKNLHQIRVYDKNTGTQVQAPFMNDAAGLAVDGQDNLWVINGNTVRKYRVESNGALSDMGLGLSGIEAPMAIAVSPDNNTVLVADGGRNQQLKAFSNQNGSPSWTMGQPGGYASDPNVSNDKFYFSDVSGKINSTFLAFAPDGSFWVGDSGNYRAQHYSASRGFLDNIQYIQHNYSSYVDQANPRRVFAQFLEYEVDYSKPLEANNGSWRLIKNWRASVPASYFDVSTINHQYITNIFQDVVTMRNGRVYGFMRRYGDNKLVVVELPANGPLRVTNVAFDYQNKYTYHITADGSLRQSIKNSDNLVGTLNWQTRPLTGFDGNNDPVWGAVQAHASAPINGGGEPIDWYGGSDRTGETTSSGVVISFDAGKINGAMGGGSHLGGVRAGDNKWLWKTAYATSVDYKGAYPIDGAYDVGNGVEYAGGGISVFERSIFWNYHGEFWKGSQVNKWQHVYDNGLLVGIFGKTGPEARAEAPDGGAVPGMAGNVYSGTVVKAPNGNVYLYHGEENGWAGIHRWRIDNLGSIQEQVIPLQVLSNYGTTQDPSGLGGVDLLSGIPRKGVLADGTAGWTRNPSYEINNAYNDSWNVKTGIMSYDRFSSPDLCATFSKENATYTVSRDLGNNSGLSSWSLKGAITFDGTNPNVNKPGEGDSGGSFFEVLDNNGRILARIYNQVFFGQEGAPVRLFGNNQQIAQGQYFDASTVTGTASDAIEITMANNALTIKYRDYTPVTVPAYDNAGNLQSPKSVRLFFWSNGRNYGRTLDVQRLRFYTTAGATTSTPPASPVTTARINSGSRYFIKAKHSGKNLDVANVSTADGARIHQWSYNGATNQQWQLTDLNNGYYSLKAVHSGKMMDIANGSTADGALAIQWASHGEANQQFKLVDVGDGYFQIVSRNSQKCLDIKDAVTGDGATVQQFGCGTGDNQKFYFTQVPSGGRQEALADEGIGRAVVVYPNPVYDVMTIQGAKGASITVTDLMGRVRLVGTCSEDSSTFSVTSLTVGEYVVRIQQGEGAVSRKLIVAGQ
ncbi:RICIN domain-containing protein [Spirosoma rigui]|uniref:RICIN domain-containing protein n=1 Tax=Spirosoma rigui TaxID=564064 RepID=UPI0009B07378|nr:RICIN domain-containing protein [Spirosoma rigui]